jgi:hypothetical protein
MPLTNPGIDWDSRVDSKPQTSALRPKEREREGERERERGLCALTPQEWSRECHRMYRFRHPLPLHGRIDSALAGWQAWGS